MAQDALGAVAERWCRRVRSGVLTLRWTAAHTGANTGIFFIVGRKRGGESDYSVITATVLRVYVDPTAHVESSQVQFRVRAMRGNDSTGWTTPASFKFAGGGVGGRESHS